MALGVVSIFAYLFFIVWEQLTAPSGPKSIPATGDFFELASSLTMGYTLHGVIVQNIIRNPNH